MTDPSITNVDVEREHSFDGITEFDNHLPNWWLWSFYLACIFSVFYWGAYHITGFAALPTEVYEADQAALAAQSTDADDETLRALLADPNYIASGKKIFDINCASCHRNDGGGMPGLGPNLTDKFWLHGGEPASIYTTVTKGVIEKGMVAWESQLGASKCRKATVYVMSLRNKNVANGREAQGEPYAGQ